MTHADAAERDLADRYVRNDLAADQARDFEEHFFSCDACFADVQAAERLRASVRDLAARGGLDDESDAAAVHRKRFPFMFEFALAASIVLAVAAGWQAIVVVPGLRSELAAERDGRQADIRQRASQEQALARGQREGAAAQAQMALAAEPNVPVAILTATRGADTAAPIALPAGAQHVVLWIDTPGAAAGAFRLAVTPVGVRTPVLTIDGLKTNRDGGLSAAVPSSALPQGSYLVRLFGISAARETLVGEYSLVIARAR